MIIILMFSASMLVYADIAIAPEAEEEEDVVKDAEYYLTTAYENAEAKLETMTLYFESDEYEIYGLEQTGEVCIKVKATGQTLFTNPYDAASSNSSDTVKQQLLSQIILSYNDVSGSYGTKNSFNDAAFAAEDSHQIVMKTTDRGLRTEYTIGRETVKYLVPRQIEKSAFEENIMSYFEKGTRSYDKVNSYYVLYDLDDPSMSETAKEAARTRYPIVEKYPIYVLDAGVGNRELLELEGYIKNTYYNDYEKIEEMYEMLDYVDTSTAPALFRFAIEYNVDENGLEITLPATSIRYDSANYTLRSVQFLPYFCAGNNARTGFTLIPDGSGTITRFEDIASKAFVLTARAYGRDYSYHSISGTYQEKMTLPAFGVLEKKNGIMQGYVAYMTEGDSLCEITADHGGTLHRYSSVYTVFYPKQNDTYVLEGVSTTGTATWTVQSDRRYTGRYTMRIFPVYGDDCDYNDMAAKIRDYMVATGKVNKKDEAKDNSEDVPIYIETFGSIKTTKKIIGFPTKIQTPLTTFKQVEEMAEDLKSEGLENINFRLTGWYNGGLEHTAPSKLNVLGVLGGKKGLKELAEYGKENNVGIYPDIDFVYVSTLGAFDRFDYKKHTVKTIDDRSAAYREYNALYQGFEEGGALIISPNAMTKFYDDIKGEIKSYGATGLSVATLGSELSSDHNPDYSLNREDVKATISHLLSEIKEDNENVMINDGNSYAVPYATHILNVPLESSLNINTSETIPFVGMVLHGNVEFAGSPINLDGDFDYSVLKAIENGANLYFILSKDNTSELKQFERFSKYYAISYDIWKQDLVSVYKKFNDAMKKVKYSYITDHEQIDEKVVRVVYGDKTEFILNYNTHSVKVDGQTVEAMSFIEREI